METIKQYKKDQRITFKDSKSSNVYTKKIKWVNVNPFNGEISYYVNPIGSGCQCEAVYHCQVISAK